MNTTKTMMSNGSPGRASASNPRSGAKYLGLATHGFHHYRTRNTMKIVGLIVLGLLCSLASAKPTREVEVGNRYTYDGTKEALQNKILVLHKARRGHYEFQDENGNLIKNGSRDYFRNLNIFNDEPHVYFGNHECEVRGYTNAGKTVMIVDLLIEKSTQAQTIIQQLNSTEDGKFTIQHLQGLQAIRGSGMHIATDDENFKLFLLMNHTNVPIKRELISDTPRRRLGAKPSDSIPRRSDIFHPRINQIFRETKKQS